MAKRFTDTDKWKKAWFRQLSPKLKCVWSYITDNCDHAGIWPIDIDLMSFQIGEKISMDELVKHFGARILTHDKTKLFLPTFIEFQYGELHEESKPHQSVIKNLRKEGLWEGYTKGIYTLKEQDKEKDKDKEQEKEQEKEREIPFQNSALTFPTSARMPERPAYVQFIAAYRSSFKERYPGVTLDIDDRTVKRIKDFLKCTPIDKAIEMIQVFCQMDGSKEWFKTKGHDFETFMSNRNLVSIALSQGAESGKPKGIAQLLAEEEAQNVAVRF